MLPHGAEARPPGKGGEGGGVEDGGPDEGRGPVVRRCHGCAPWECFGVETSIPWTPPGDMGAEPPTRCGKPADLELRRQRACRRSIDADEYERWGRAEFVLDVSPGAAEGFSVGLADAHFVTR